MPAFGRFLAIAALPFAAIGCRVVGGSPTVTPISGSPTVAPPRGSSTPADLRVQWRLEFTRSGGFAGEVKTLLITHDGALEAIDELEGQRTYGTLTNEELWQISQLLRATLQLNPGPSTGDCTDCYTYTIRLDIVGKPREVTLDDRTLPGSGYEQLVEALSSILLAQFAES